MTNRHSICDLFIALGAGLFVSVILLFCTADNLVHTVITFFGGPFSSLYYLGSLFDRTGLLLCAAAGICFAFKSGNFNLGGEGQIYTGGLITAIVLNSISPLDSVFPAGALLAAFIAAALSAGFCGYISGILKTLRGTNELLTSFLISSAVIPFINYAISGPLRGKTGTLLATSFIPEHMRLKSLIPPSVCNISVFIAVVFCFQFFFIIFRTRTGYVIRTCGLAPQFARYCGFPIDKIDIAGMSISAAMHGITGFFAVTGTYYTCHNGFYAGMGWNALSVALMAKSNPLAVIPAGFLFSYLLTAADQAVLTGTLKSDSTYLIQAAVLFTVSAQFIHAQKTAPRKQCKTTRRRTHDN